MNKKIFSTVSCGVLVPTVSSSFVLAQDANISNIANVAGENNMADDLFIKDNRESNIEKGRNAKPYFKYFSIAALLLIIDFAARYHVKCSIYKGLNELVDKLLPIYEKAVNEGWIKEADLVKKLENSICRLSFLGEMHSLLNGEFNTEKILLIKEGFPKDYKILNTLFSYSEIGNGIYRRFNRFYSILGLFKLKNELNKHLKEFDEDEVVEGMAKEVAPVKN